MPNVKIFAAYLPQYHETEENNKFWGKGFTDWSTVKAAESLFRGHGQPYKPLNENYYDLSDPDAIKRQAEMAKRYGVDGFNIYHYWFKNDHAVLQKPAELLLKNKEIDVEYFFTWDNSSWKRSWSNVPGNDWTTKFEPIGKRSNESALLLEMNYGNEEQWRNHFDYLLPFFKDPRYLKINNAPVFMFFTNTDQERLRRMGESWNVWAKENGFAGLFLATQKGPFRNHRIFDTEFYYQPNHAAWAKRRAIENRIAHFLPALKTRKGPFLFDYEKVWKKVYRESKRGVKNNEIVGGFVRYDDTPRRGTQGTVIVGNSVELFRKYFEKQYRLSCRYGTGILLLTAWNEWGEGAFLEPDIQSEYQYLEVISEVKSRMSESGCQVLRRKF